ncbi:MAG TPA: hypothetical protein VGV87_19215 [Blastocatellia bacterium]|jgi:hypothetical protein|nr:hypothetical protein [Blastocatellia bacterium]
MAMRPKITWIGCGVLAFFCAAVKDSAAGFSGEIHAAMGNWVGRAEFEEPDADRDDLPAVAPVA